MEKFYIPKINELKKNRKELQKKLNVEIKISGRNVFISGDSLNEYEAKLVFDAIEFGFAPKKALLLKNEDYIFKIIHIKSHTKRKLKDVIARIVGKKGKTKHTISEISGCELIIKESEAGILGYVENATHAEEAIIKIIKGSKQSNTYRFLERMNRAKKEHYE